MAGMGIVPVDRCTPVHDHVATTVQNRQWAAYAAGIEFVDPVFQLIQIHLIRVREALACGLVLGSTLHRRT